MHVVDTQKDISPDFARLLIGFPFGDIYSRPGRDLRSLPGAASRVSRVRASACPTCPSPGVLCSRTPKRSAVGSSRLDPDAKMGAFMVTLYLSQYQSP
jgi:hypothetical protein